MQQIRYLSQQQILVLKNFFRLVLLIFQANTQSKSLENQTELRILKLKVISINIYSAI